MRVGASVEVVPGWWDMQIMDGEICKLGPEHAPTCSSTPCINLYPEEIYLTLPSDFTIFTSSLPENVEEGGELDQKGILKKSLKIFSKIVNPVYQFIPWGDLSHFAVRVYDLCFQFARKGWRRGWVRPKRDIEKMIKNIF